MASAITVPAYSVMTDAPVIAAITTAKSEISDLQSEISGLQSGIAGLQGDVVSLTDDTVTLSAETHGNKTNVLNRAAGITVTLPPATGSGVKFPLFVGTSVTSNGYIVQAANASDVFCGYAVLFADEGDTVVGFAAGADSDTLTMDGTTKGGLKGAKAVFTDIAENLWHVEYVSDASGTEATPFSSAVS